VGTNPSFFSANGGAKERVKGLDTRKFPVEQVPWGEAVAYCQKLSERDGKRRFRLPSEAEWEYACRAGTETPFHFGSSLNGDKANCDGNHPYGTNEKGRDVGRTCRVGSYAANAFGLFDMHGNVSEWCQDWYGPYHGLAEKDPLRTEEAGESARVLRGGSWYSFPWLCRAAGRGRYAPASTGNDGGFRVAFLLD
jgi:formylglycine-generating enzyme required for sulfatase activity